MKRDRHNENHYLQIKKATGGYLLSHTAGAYSGESQPIICPTFVDVLTEVAEFYGEEDFSNTIKETQAVSVALEGFFGKIIAPKLLAIEAKINPGIENLEDDDSKKKSFDQ